MCGLWPYTSAPSPYCAVDNANATLCASFMALSVDRHWIARLTRPLITAPPPECYSHRADDPFTRDRVVISPPLKVQIARARRLSATAGRDCGGNLYTGAEKRP